MQYLFCLRTFQTLISDPSLLQPNRQNNKSYAIKRFKVILQYEDESINKMNVIIIKSYFYFDILFLIRF